MTDLQSPREAAVATILTRLEALTETVRGGEQDGVEVIPLAAARDAVLEPLDPANAFTADIRTPGRVVVSAICPSCGLHAEIGLSVTTELRMDEDGSTLHLKGKSKAKSHTCGQTTLFGASSEEFDVADIIGSGDEAGDD